VYCLTVTCEYNYILPSPILLACACPKQERYDFKLIYCPLCQIATLFCSLLGPGHSHSPGDDSIWSRM